MKSEVKTPSNAVTKNVTNCSHKMAFFIRCNQFCNQTEGSSGQRRAMESISSGHPGQPGATEGNQTIGLITQRSHVQIMPPQPTTCSFSFNILGHSGDTPKKHQKQPIVTKNVTNLRSFLDFRVLTVPQ